MAEARARAGMTPTAITNSVAAKVAELRATRAAKANAGVRGTGGRDLGTVEIRFQHVHNSLHAQRLRSPWAWPTSAAPNAP